MTLSAGDYFKLHFVVLLFSFTGIFGKLVSIPAVEMVFYRTLFAAGGLLILLATMKGAYQVTRSDLIKLILTGFIVSVHWLTFFISGRVANVSVSLVGFATASLWTALLEPLFKGYKIRPIELIFGAIVMAGLYIIFASDFSYSVGLLLGVASGLTCAIFTIINSQLVNRVAPLTITFYEMIGASIATSLFFPFYLKSWSPTGELQLVPSSIDWVWILLLAWLCTIYAYAAGVELMKRMSVFLFQLTLNLEPVYGIAMAVVIFGESERMNARFYAGTAVMLTAVVLYPWLKRKLTAIPTTP